QQIDVITMDIEMPVMDGISAINKIMDLKPTPIIVLSAYAESGAGPTIEALQMGAVDFIRKPSGPISFDIEKVKSDLIGKIRNAVKIDIKSRNKQQLIFKKKKYDISELNQNLAIVIGASTGGPKALTLLLKEFPYNFPAPILIVQHMPEGFTRQFAKHLNRDCKINIEEAKDGTLIRKGNAYIAKAGYHMMLESIDEDKNLIRLIRGEKINSVMPSCEPLFDSAAKIYRNNLIGIVLTGMGKDGANGIKTIKNFGGITIAESKNTAMIFGMPKAAIETGAIDFVKSLNEIPDLIIKIMTR
ncbi:MAG: chemotaxis-specific protein-glutamate methyltransferase CheB, partial [Proteobacteria bacterium]|nr:chemotaxis-specific protein-glutamate methyltransferase CheB [Pseudomonadota bacterium]